MYAYQDQVEQLAKKVPGTGVSRRGSEAGLGNPIEVDEACDDQDYEEEEARMLALKRQDQRKKMIIRRRYYNSMNSKTGWKRKHEVGAGHQEH